MNVPSSHDRSKADAERQKRIEACKATQRRIERDYRSLGPESSDAVNLLLTQAQKNADIVSDRLKGLDGKATTLIGIVTTGVGAFALFSDPSKAPPRTIFLYSGLAALLLSLVLSLIALLPRPAPYPDLDDYLFSDTVRDAANAPRIKFDLAGAWSRDADAINRSTGLKGRLLIWAIIALSVGVSLLAFNYVEAGGIAAPAVTGSPSPTRSPSMKALHNVR